MSPRFTDAPLGEIIEELSKQTAATVTIEVPNPALGGRGGLCSGEVHTVEGVPMVHRGYRCWTDLGEQLQMELTGVAASSTPQLVELTFRRLEAKDSFRGGDREERSDRERYGAGTPFSRIAKLEEPGIALPLQRSLRRLDLPRGARILDLGVNDGEELGALRDAYGGERFASFDIVGVEHSATAVAAARRRWCGSPTGPRCEFLCEDINELGSLGLGRFDLLLSLATLHSPSVGDPRGLLRMAVREHLEPSGAVLLGYPNCRWVDGALVYGARARHHRGEAEKSVLLKEVDYCKRYLQRHRFRVTVTGKYNLLVAATRIDRKASNGV